MEIRSPKPEARRGSGSRARAGPLRDRGQRPVASRRPETAWRTCRGSFGGGSSGWIGRGASSALSAKSGDTRTSASRRTAGRSRWRCAIPSHGQNLDVWVLDASRGTGSRITAERTDEFDPAWFPDGERLVYVSDHVGFYDLYERPASGGAEKILVRTQARQGPADGVAGRPASALSASRRAPISLAF